MSGFRTIPVGRSLTWRARLAARTRPVTLVRWLGQDARVADVMAAWVGQHGEAIAACISATPSVIADSTLI